MAVFTEVSTQAAQALFDHLGLGRVRSLHGIEGGIENTNYFVDSETGRWVLTLFERLSAQQLPFYLELMKHLARAGIPVPDPQAGPDGALLHSVCGKPAAVVNRLAGASELQPSAAHCAEVGTLLARLHRAARDFDHHQANLRGLSWWNEVAPQVLPHLAPDQAALLRSELAFQNHVAAGADHAALPRGTVHADLFRDNVLFDGGRLSGVFDFYFAGVDSWLFDLAVALNDWCVDLRTGIHESGRAGALLAAYQRLRPLSRAERSLFNAMLRAGALRFWLSRLWDWHLPREASMLKPHDPGHFERVLRGRIAHPVAI